MGKAEKFKPTHLWQRLNPKERTKWCFQAHFAPGHSFTVTWDRHMEEQWIKQSFDMWCKASAPELTPSPNPGILLYSVLKYTERMTKQLLCSHAREKAVHFSSHAESTGSRGLGLPDKLWARMWSLGAAPNPNLKSLLPAHHCLTILVCDGWLAPAWSLIEKIRYLPRMRGFNLVSGRNPALGGIKHRFNNPNNSFWP